MMRDVQFMHRTSEKIKVAAIGQDGDNLEQKMDTARSIMGKSSKEPICE